MSAYTNTSYTGIPFSIRRGEEEKEKEKKVGARADLVGVRDDALGGEE